MIKKLKKKILNFISNFLCKYYEYEFHKISYKILEDQGDMIIHNAKEAAELGVDLYIIFDIDTIPMGMKIAHGESEIIKPDLRLVPDEENE